jgi:hypothetical protein
MQGGIRGQPGSPDDRLFLPSIAEMTHLESIFPQQAPGGRQQWADVATCIRHYSGWRYPNGCCEIEVEFDCNPDSGIDNNNLVMIFDGRNVGYYPESKSFALDQLCKHPADWN